MTITPAEAIEPSAPTHRLRIALIVIGAIATLGAPAVTFARSVAIDGF